MHCVGLARSGLSIGEDGGMIALKCLLNEMIHLALLIDLTLRAVLIKDVVKIELAIGLPVLHLHLSTLSHSADAVVCISILEFSLEKGPDAYGCLDLAHLIILIGDSSFISYYARRRWNCPLEH